MSKVTSSDPEYYPSEEQIAILLGNTMQSVSDLARDSCILSKYSHGRAELISVEQISDILLSLLSEVEFWRERRRELTVKKRGNI